METTDVLIITKKRREYVQANAYPKISVDADTYKLLQEAAWQANRPISYIARQFIEFASERTEYVEE